MILRHLALTNFKNIRSAELDFSPKVNCLLGNNGMGKSNLLDAIYFLSFTKSYTRVPDSMLITTGESFGILSGEYTRGQAEEELTAGLRAGARKTFRRGGKEYKRLSSHIGLFPAVMIAPADLELVSGPSEVRRRFIDMIISQSDPRYLDALIRYGQALDQRNRLLKDDATDPTLFLSVEMVMAAAADYIRARRVEAIGRLSEVFGKYYSRIGGENESVELALEISGAEDGAFADALEHYRSRDRILRHTSVGPHRDDLVMTLNGMEVRRTASQGQTKSVTIALRFAQYDFLRRSISVKPLLLLDDIFDKLDALRVERIISIVATQDFGQIFITDTNRKYLDEIMRAIKSDYRIWAVTDGAFTLMS